MSVSETMDCALCAVSKKAAEQAAQELAAAKAESSQLAALVKQHEQTIAQLEIARKQATDDKADAVRASEADKNTIRDLEKRLDDALQKSLLDSGRAASLPPPTPPPPPTPTPLQMTMPQSAAAGAALPLETGAAQESGRAAKAAEAGKDNKRKEQPVLGPGEEAVPAKKHKAHARYCSIPRVPPPFVACAENWEKQLY